jgi:uncharacterized membrane protein
MKRAVTKQEKDFLQQELAYLEKEKHLETDQVNTILSVYEVQPRFHFIRILLVIGSLLVGIGILSFIAGNWDVFPKTAKLLILFIGLIGAYFAGWKTEEIYPKTSKSLYYLGIFIYGAGIFLIGQMFHLQSDSGDAFLAWSAGILPLALYLKDRWVSLMSILLMGIYVYYSWISSETFMLFVLGLIFLALMYWINETKIKRSYLIFFFNNSLLVFWVIVMMVHFEVHDRFIPIVIFIIGLVFTFLPNSHYSRVLNWQGTLFHGTAGIFFTLASYWHLWGYDTASRGIGVGFAILYLLFALFLLKRGSLPAIVVVCAIIIRFYIDFSFYFLPKSLFFVLGGVLLIAFGYWFEKRRREEAK